MTPNRQWPIYFILLAAFSLQTRALPLPNEPAPSPSPNGLDPRPMSIMYNYDIRQSIIFNFDQEDEPEQLRAPSILHEYDSEEEKVQRHWEGRPRQLIATIWEPSSADFDPNIECPFCLDEFGTDSNAIKLTNCGHSLHERCFLKIAEDDHNKGRGSTCPVCRESFQA